MALNTLSGRFLGLTVIFVVIATVLVSVPSITRFRDNYLQSRLELGELGALAMLNSSGDAASEGLQSILLQTSGLLNVVLWDGGVRELVLSAPFDGQVAESYDLVHSDTRTRIQDALHVLFLDQDRIIKVTGATGRGIVEVTMHETPLRMALVDHAKRIFYVSLGLSLATAALLFLAVQRLIVRPIDRVVAHMTAFRDDPEDSTRIISPREGARELHEAEVALHDLEVRLVSALRQKERLAQLGSAVAKISHDLRNMLTTAQLLADRIDGSDDPAVRRTAPKLVGSLARAIHLCERTLDFGRAEELPPVVTIFRLAPLVGEVLENEGSGGSGLARVAASLPGDLLVRGDPDQLFRVLTNLVRNGVQAVEATGQPASVTVIAAQVGGTTEIRVRDTGPGLPEKARENLFRPFRGSARPGGSGLGLAIAGELVRGHGGTVTLEETGSRGSTFLVCLPSPTPGEVALAGNGGRGELRAGGA
ncbi:signal transduction histidine kinase [Amaricoccus macauensis]|uniref:histidine kinase n=1 Tax=Amaricoccus macauensis TaxID=57001 RepID=A0A840SWU1_9RHOB|nr:HAMP domain-containing sensor histidine kinase [Amaricoccus macauensis]MBB5223601.1 signal transduction histidine kinase [Amaricoccus macauensis]